MNGTVMAGAGGREDETKMTATREFPLLKTQVRSGDAAQTEL